MRIAAVGACTPVGLNAPSAAAAVRAGVTTFGAHPYMVDADGDVVMVAQVPGIDPYAPTLDRMTVLARTALREVIESCPALPRVAKLPVVLAVPDLRPGMDPNSANIVADAVARELDRLGLRVDLAIVQTGHAGGLIALRECCISLSRGSAPWGLVGGVDSWLEPETIEWLQRDERLHTPANPWGLIPGEGAAFCAVWNPASLGELPGALGVVGMGVAAESVPRRGEEPCLGIGLTAAVREAIAPLPEAERVHEIFCDCNGERDRAEEYGFALVRAGERFVDASAMRAPADCWGDVGCATGTLLLALGFQAAARGWLAGPNILAWSSSDGPQRAAVVLRAPLTRE